MKRHLVLITLVVGMFMISLVANQSVQAQETGIALGLGVGAKPDYEGSEDYEAVPLPFVNVKWSNHMSINWLGNKAKVNLIPSPIWRGGLVGEYIPERDDVDNNRVDRLEDVDTSFMLGGFFGFEYSNWSASIEAMADVADGNDGAIVRLNGGYKIPIDQSWLISLGAFTTWADDDYMEAYFEIDNRDSARSGLKTFKADSGFKDVGLNLRASFKPWEHWGFMGLVSYKRLLDDAEDSPVVDDEGDENQFLGGILVTYNF
jgi:outer membrane scaffolding protein for murein synthesis (MipA/OmpV family)